MLFFSVFFCVVTKSSHPHEFLMFNKITRKKNKLDIKYPASSNLYCSSKVNNEKILLFIKSRL